MTLDDSKPPSLMRLICMGIENDGYTQHHDREPGADERMKLEGWHIVSSDIILTCIRGQNRILVKRT